MAAERNPDRDREPDPLTDVTRWGLVADIAYHFRRGTEALRAGDERIEFDPEHHQVIIKGPPRRPRMFGPVNREVYRVHLQGSGSETQLTATRDGDPRQVPLSETAAQHCRKLIAEGGGG